MAAVEHAFTTARNRTVELPKPIPAPGPWLIHALCLAVGPSQFFPEAVEDADTGLAYCAVCPVLAECRDYARSNRIPHGTWGGETEWDRKPQRRLRVITEHNARPAFAEPKDSVDEDTCPFCDSELVVPGAGTMLMCLDCRGRWPHAV